MDNEQPAGIGHNSGWGAPAEVEAPPVTIYPVEYVSQPETEEPESFRLRRNAEIQAWLGNKEIAVNATALEKDSRGRVTATLFPTPKKGTQRYDLGGAKVKLVQTYNYKLGIKDLVRDEKTISIRTQINQLEETFEKEFPAEAPILLDLLIRWTPELSGSKYEELAKKESHTPAEERLLALISEVLTVEPGSPQLTFEPAKEA